MSRLTPSTAVVAPNRFVTWSKRTKGRAVGLAHGAKSRFTPPSTLLRALPLLMANSKCRIANTTGRMPERHSPTRYSLSAGRVKLVDEHLLGAVLLLALVHRLARLRTVVVAEPHHRPRLGQDGHHAV